MPPDVLHSLIGLIDLRELFVGALLLLARLGLLAFVAPFLGGALVPAAAKPVVVLALGAVFMPQAMAGAARLAGQPDALLVAIAVKEALVGFALGFVVSLVFHAAQAAGWLADAARGANLGESLVPQLGQRSSPLGSLSFQLTLVLFFALGGHRLFVAAIAASYEALPVSELPNIASLREFALLSTRLSGDLVLVALTLSAPVVAACVLADLTLGVVNRFAPQVNVFFLAMPLKALLGVGAFALSLGLLLAALPPLLDAALQQVERAIAILGG